MDGSFFDERELFQFVRWSERRHEILDELLEAQPDSSENNISNIDVAFKYIEEMKLQADKQYFRDDDEGQFWYPLCPYDFIKDFVRAFKGEPDVLCSMEKVFRLLRGPRDSNGYEIKYHEEQWFGTVLQDTCEQLCDDKTFVLRMIRENEPDYFDFFNYLLYVSDRLKDDPDVVLEAWLHLVDWEYYGIPSLPEVAPAEVLENKAFMIRAVENFCSIPPQTSDSLRDDEEFVEMAIQLNGRNLEEASPRLRNDKRLVSIAVQSYPAALQCVSAQLLDDYDVVKLAVSNDGAALKHCSRRLQDHFGIVILALQNQQPHEFTVTVAHASPRLRDNFDIVITAILGSPPQRASDVLHYASKRLQNDYHIVMAAIQKMGPGFLGSPPSALLHVSERLRGNFQISLGAVRKNGHDRKWVSAALQQNMEIWTSAELQKRNLPPTNILMDQVRTPLSLLPSFLERGQVTPVLGPRPFAFGRVQAKADVLVSVDRTIEIFKTIIYFILRNRNDFMELYLNI